MPTVSVIIPTYNRAAMLSLAIDSVRSQTFHEWELIVVDDGSTDGTAEIVRRAAREDAKIRLVQQPNRGLAEARNAGIRVSRGTYLAFLDDDDRWLPEKLELQVRCMERSPKPGLSYTLTANSDMEGRVYRTVPEVAGRSYAELLMHNFIPCPSVMVRRDCLERVGFFHKEMNPAEDYDLWLRIAAIASLDVVPYPLAIYRRHGRNMSDKTLAMYQADLRVLEQQRHEARIRGMGGLWRQRIAGVHYEIARWAMDQRKWALECAALFGAIRRAPHAGLIAKSYRAAGGWRRLYDAVKPYLALGYCGARWAAHPNQERS